MKKVYYFICNKYKKFKISEISYIVDKTSVLCIICDKCGSNDEKIFKEEELTKILVESVIRMSNLSY